MVRESLTVAYSACGGGGAGVRGKRGLPAPPGACRRPGSAWGSAGRCVTELACVAGSGSAGRLIAVWALIRQRCRYRAVDYLDFVDV